MQIIPITSLVIPENRQRREFDEKKIQDLANSINSKGLMHPPVVRAVGDQYILVAGERRTRAIQSLHILDMGVMCNDTFVPPGQIPVTLLSDLDDFALREAELEENTIRVDLSWQEQAAAVAALHALRSDQMAVEGKTQTVAATASEILGKPSAGGQQSRISEALIIAKHLDDPDVQKAKTSKEAMKVLQKKAEVAKRARLAETFDKAKTPHTLIHGDSLVELHNLPDASFDLILTDPPYGVGADTFGDMASTGHEYRDDPEYAQECYGKLAREGYRITKDKAHAYVFCDIRNFSAIALEFTLAGWTVWERPMIWSKKNGMLPKPDFGPRLTYEAILFASKNSRKVLKVGAPDVLEFTTEGKNEHGAQKPVTLYAELIARSCYPGDTVLDCFAGSGTIFPAANSTRTIATGIEISKTYHDLAQSRMLGEPDLLEELGL